MPRVAYKLLAEEDAGTFELRVLCPSCVDNGTFSGAPES